ncbi:MAG: class I SAM-dependent methyltransferase, partial [Bacteroidota bacterium]
MDAYDQIAAWYTSTRDPTSGADEIEAFARQLAPGSAVLDVGCGDGVPVSRLLHRAGLALTALDSSRAMVERYRANVPDVPVRHASVLDAEFDAGTFAGIVAWGVLFHLTLEDQADAFGRISTWLAPAGRLLFTSGGT